MYRKELCNCTYSAEEAMEYNNNSLYVEKSEVINMIDNIESRVNDIKDALEPIKGLSEIEDIKDMIESLLKDLF